MPQTVKPTELDFLRELDAWIARGLPAYQFGVPASTITYRLRAVGLVAKRAVGLVDIRDGRSLAELIETGEIAVADPSPATPAQAA